MAFVSDTRDDDVERNGAIYELTEITMIANMALLNSGIAHAIA